MRLIPCPIVGDKDKTCSGMVRRFTTPGPLLVYLYYTASQMSRKHDPTSTIEDSAASAVYQLF